jgi:beta-lactamase regulating signal transducer with metallopeptidase domain
LWQGLAIALALVLLVQLAGIRRARSRYACSLAALVLMLVCPALTFAWLNGSEIPVAGANDASLSQHIAGEMASALFAPRADALAALLGALQPYALAAWLMGVTLFAVRLAAGALGIARLRRKLTPLPLDLASSVERLGRRLSIDALPLVFLSKQVGEALAVGLVRPLVLIPAAWATEMPLPLLEAVIAHELAHVRRRDLWINLLQRVVETLLFYHPAVWWLSRRLRIERELCADELAVRATGRRLEYAEALEQVARRRQAEIRPALAAFMRGEKNMRLLERVRNVLGLTAAERSRLWPAGLVALALPLGLWAASLGLTASADEDREEQERPKVEREADVPREDAEESAEAKFFAKRRDKEEERDDGDREEGRRDGDEPKKEGPRDGEERKKEGPRDGEVKKKGPRDGDEPRKKEGPRDGDKPGKKEGDYNPDAAIFELKHLVAKLMAENERLRAELASVRAGKEGVRKEGSEKFSAEEKYRAAAERKEAQARERKEAFRKELERKEGERQADFRKEDLRKKDFRKEGERKEVERKEVERKEVERKDGDERKEVERKEVDDDDDRKVEERKDGEAR